MALVLEIAFAAASSSSRFPFSPSSWGRRATGSCSSLTVVLATGAAVAAVALGIDLVDSYTDVDALLLAAGGIGAAAVAEAGLLALNRGLRRMQQIEQLTRCGPRRESTPLPRRSRSQRILELERMLGERAGEHRAISSASRSGAWPRRRRDTVERQAERASVELTQTVASVQERLEQRLMAWAADLDRGQRELERKLVELGQQQREAVTAYEARLAADAERVDAASEEQRVALMKLREELQRFGTSFLEEGRSEIEIHAAERRRALHEMSERIRSRERALREQLERDEAESRGRIAAGLEESERRHLAALDRAFERAATRLTEYAEKQFDAQIKESREKAADRLSRELEKAIEQFARQAEKDVADRIADMARMTADRLQRRINDVARSAEAQHEVAAERVRHLAARLEETLAAAEERQAALEAEARRFHAQPRPRLKLTFPGRVRPKETEPTRNGRDVDHSRAGTGRTRQGGELAPPRPHGGRLSASPRRADRAERRGSPRGGRARRAARLPPGRRRPDLALKRADFFQARPAELDSERVKVEPLLYGDRKVYTVSAFNRGVASWVARLPSIWVEGEVTEFRRQQGWQSVFFTLKDSATVPAFPSACRAAASTAFGSISPTV